MTADDDRRPDPERIGYAAALAELEEILERLEHTDVDVDELGGAVQRAAALIDVCRQRLDAARVEVERIVADLDDSEDVPHGDEPV